MEVGRAVYVVADGTLFDRWVRRGWRRRSPIGDPLRRFVVPVDMRGEVTAWGDSVHWTIHDYLSTQHAADFARIVKSTCAAIPSPVIQPHGLDIFARIALVIKCSSPSTPSFEDVKVAIARATRHLIARAPLTDEEWQRGEWWIRSVGRHIRRNVAALHEAREWYLHEGQPLLPSARFFRLGFLMRLWKEYQSASAARRPRRERALRRFVREGQPQWHTSRGSLHTTIFAGLRARTPATRARLLAHARRHVWPEVQRTLGTFQPEYLAIMGEHPTRKVRVQVYDWLTETFVQETRPAVTIVDRAPFA